MGGGTQPMSVTSFPYFSPCPPQNPRSRPVAAGTNRLRAHHFNWRIEMDALAAIRTRQPRSYTKSASFLTSEPSISIHIFLDMIVISCAAFYCVLVVIKARVHILLVAQHGQNGGRTEHKSRKRKLASFYKKQNKYLLEGSMV